jgi:hypothetical protein
MPGRTGNKEQQQGTKGLEMKKTLSMAALAIFALLAAQFTSAGMATAADRNFAGLDQYALGQGASGNSAVSGLLAQAREPGRHGVTVHEEIKVASRRSRRRNRAIVGGIAVGIAALIIADAIRRERRRDRYYNYDDDYYYNDRPRVTNRKCRRWARRCDRGVRRACRKLYRHCEAY